MAGSLLPEPKQQFLNDIGVPLFGGQVFTYAAGTLTPKATYQDQALTIANTNPVVANDRGEVVMYGSGSYRVILKDLFGNTIYDRDDIETPDVVVGEFLSSLSLSSGSSLVGFIQDGGGAVARTSQSKMRERVSISDFRQVTDPDDTLSVTRAISTGARKVVISIAAFMSSGVALSANQVIDFDGGSITMTAGATAPNGVLYASNKAGIRIIDPLIDCSSTAGLGGISLTDCPGATIVDGLLVKSNLALISTNNTIRSGYKVRGLVINMSGLLVTSAYISGVKTATFSDVEAFGGKEGFGLYNGCINISFSNCQSHDHTQDGFVIISGKGTTHTGCHSYSNGQSGFTTQRATAQTDCTETSYADCHAYLNVFDGFDMRGATTTPWSFPMRLTLTGCHAWKNTGTGFYVINAEYSSLSGCTASLNSAQGIFVQASSNVLVSGCHANSNCAALPGGTFNAGILFANSSNCSLSGSSSSNPLGAAQNYGASFVGTSLDCSISGGYFENDILAPFNIDGTAGVSIAGVSILISANKWLLSRNGDTKVEQYCGFGVPAFTAQKGSTFQRADGGGGELYISDGGSTWHLV